MTIATISSPTSPPSPPRPAPPVHQKFADSHKIALPFAVDPQGKLAALVKADYALGQRIGIEHTPTIWVVTANSKGAPFVEVVDRSQLYQIIDQAMADTKDAKPAPKPVAKKSTK